MRQYTYIKEDIMESKEIGAIGEFSFSIEAIKRGFSVSQPVVDSLKYDFIVEGKNLYKVQVKTTSQPIKGKNNAYKFFTSHGSKGKRAYFINDVDIIVLYILPLEIFYIVPIKEINSTTCRVYPLKENHKYNKYKEAWHYLSK